MVHLKCTLCRVTPTNWSTLGSTSSDRPSTFLSYTKVLHTLIKYYTCMNVAIRVSPGLLSLSVLSLWRLSSHAPESRARAVHGDDVLFHCRRGREGGREGEREMEGEREGGRWREGGRERERIDKRKEAAKGRRNTK